MSDIPSIKATEFIRVIQRLGFRFDRQRGSHAIYKHPETMERIVVAVHRGKDLKKKTLAGMLKDMGLDIEEFVRLLRQC